MNVDIKVAEAIATLVYFGLLDVVDMDIEGGLHITPSELGIKYVGILRMGWPDLCSRVDSVADVVAVNSGLGLRGGSLPDAAEGSGSNPDQDRDQSSNRSHKGHAKTGTRGKDRNANAPRSSYYNDYGCEHNYRDNY